MEIQVPAHLKYEQDTFHQLDLAVLKNISNIPSSISFEEELRYEPFKRKCEAESCNNIPKYAYLGQKPRFCGDHRLQGMIHAISKKCKFEGCTKSPSYAFAGQRPQYCKSHKSSSMVNVKKKLCIEPGCVKQPSYGFRKGGGPQYCHGHRKEGMVTLMNKLCLHEGCMKHPTYGFPDDIPARPLYCKGHSLKGMRDVKRKICQEPDCRKTPSFAFEGQRPSYCKNHMKEGMSNIVSKTCDEANCTKQQMFGDSGERPKFCQDHAKFGMVNVKKRKTEDTDSSLNTESSNSFPETRLNLIQTAIALSSESNKFALPMSSTASDVDTVCKIETQPGVDSLPAQSYDPQVNFCYPPYSYFPRNFYDMQMPFYPYPNFENSCFYPPLPPPFFHFPQPPDSGNFRLSPQSTIHPEQFWPPFPFCSPLSGHGPGFGDFLNTPGFQLTPKSFSLLRDDIGSESQIEVSVPTTETAFKLQSGPDQSKPESTVETENRFAYPENDMLSSFETAQNDIQVPDVQHPSITKYFDLQHTTTIKSDQDSPSHTRKKRPLFVATDQKALQNSEGIGLHTPFTLSGCSLPTPFPFPPWSPYEGSNYFPGFTPRTWWDTPSNSILHGRSDSRLPWGHSLPTPSAYGASENCCNNESFENTFRDIPPVPSSNVC